MVCQWLPLVPMVCQWVLPLVSNLADNLEGRQNYQRAKWLHVQDCSLWKFRNYCTILLGSRVKIPLKITYIAKLLVLATPVSICSYNGVVENDDLLSLFITSRKLPMATDIRSEFSDCQWYQCQPMAANCTSGKITNGTIGKTPNARCVMIPSTYSFVLFDPWCSFLWLKLIISIFYTGFHSHMSIVTVRAARQYAIG